MTTTTPRPSEAGASAPPQKPAKVKRTFTPANFLKTVAYAVVSSGPAILLAASGPKPKTFKAALREKVMLGVTSITDCRYCAVGAHPLGGMAHGVPLEEVNQILGHDRLSSLKAKDPAEAAAILFARHYAEQLDEIDPESVKNLSNFFSPPQVRENLGQVHVITFTNLSGNTVDVLLQRIRGPRSPRHGL